MNSLYKIRIDDENISKQKLNNENIKENMSNNEISTDNFIKNTRINYEMKKRNKTVSFFLEDYKSIRENKEIKYDKNKIINSNNNNKLNRNNNITKNFFNYQIIKMILHFFISYIPEIKNNLNYELNWLFIFILHIIMDICISNEIIKVQRLIQLYKILYTRKLILLFINGLIIIFINIKFRIVLRRAMDYIKEKFRKILNSIEKITLFKRIKDINKIFELTGSRKLKNEDNIIEGKLEEKIKNVIIKNYIAYINYIIIVIIKFFIMINLYYRTKSNINDFNFLKNSKITLKVKGIGENAIINNNFQNISYLRKVYINKEIQPIKTYKYFFNQTDNFVELIWNDNIITTENMFKECMNITEINLSNFDTTLVISMDNMFEGCSSLTSLDLTNFKTSLLKRMIFMFSQCSSLTSLDLSNFDTSLVTRMDSMFSQCSSLTSLDLSSFNTTLVTSIDSMFYECINLEYINLYNFNENNIKHSMFENVPKNLVICIKDNSLFNSLNNALCNSSSSNEIFDHCFTIDCSPDWKAKQKKIININNKCVESCDDYNLIEYNGKCYERCPKEILYDNDGLNKKCKCELDKCLLCPQVALNKDLCTRCNTNYYTKENDPLNLGEYINCYNNPEGYYFDKNFYKECYKSCKTCNNEGNEENHNCITCHKNYPYVIKTNDKLNCYSSCKYYYYY